MDIFAIFVCIGAVPEESTAERGHFGTVFFADTTIKSVEIGYHNKIVRNFNT